MNRILHWLIVKLSGTGSTEAHGVSKDYKPSGPDTSSDLQGNNDDLKPDIYEEATGDIQPDDDTQPDLEVIENPPPTSEESEGFDPYNTGGFKVPEK